jgi:hypothetical protein
VNHAWGVNKFYQPATTVTTRSHKFHAWTFFFWSQHGLVAFYCKNFTTDNLTLMLIFLIVCKGNWTVKMFSQNFDCVYKMRNKTGAPCRSERKRTTYYRLCNCARLYNMCWRLNVKLKYVETRQLLLNYRRLLR